MSRLLLQLCMMSVAIDDSLALQQTDISTIRRRGVIKSIFGTASAVFRPLNNPPAFADDDVASAYKYENRDRNQNKDALIREDYWYFSGRKPPRRLNIDAFPADDPSWNAWGECTKSGTTGNSCVYVSLKQRIPAYGNTPRTVISTRLLPASLPVSLMQKQIVI